MNHKGGRKIKRSKNLYGRRRSRTRGVITAVLMVVVVGGLVFLGYSVGPPIMEFLKNGKQGEPSSEPWSPDSVLSSVESSGLSSGSETPPSDTSSNASSVPEPSAQLSALQLKQEDLSSLDALNMVLSSAKSQGYPAVILPMKLPGGSLTYSSAVPMAVESGASAPVGLSAAQIGQAVTGAGLRAIAEVSTLQDHVIPKKDKTAGYTFQNSQSAWYDNEVGKGGKPWMSPFSESAKGYFTALADELYTAGFDSIICSDVVFPPFRSSDLNYIGPIVKDAGRYQALINTVGAFQQSALEYGKNVLVRVSAKAAAEGTAEVLKPTELPGIGILMDYQPTEVGDQLTVNGAAVSLADLPAGERARQVLTLARQAAGELEVTPAIHIAGLSEEDTAAIQTVCMELGYQNYIVVP